MQGPSLLSTAQHALNKELNGKEYNMGIFGEEYEKVVAGVSDNSLSVIKINQDASAILKPIQEFSAQK